MRNLKLVTLLIFMVTVGINSYGQDAKTAVVSSDSLSQADAMDLEEYLPPLSVLIDSAVANATDVSVLENQIKISEFDQLAKKNDWAQLVSLNGTYRYGQIRSSSIENVVVFPEDNLTLGYQLGVTVRIPLSYFVDRKNEMKSLQLKTEILEDQKEGAIRQVKQDVITTYQHLLLIQRLLKIMTEAKESSTLIAEMAEDRFRDGEIDLDQLGNTTNLKAQSATQFETLRTEFSDTYAMLERLVGTPLIKLKN